MIIACIFAHPDDEAFGPGGTIATLTKEHEVHLLCATDGGAGARPVRRGKNHSNDKTLPLGALRQKELYASAKILGIKEVAFLGFDDGTLCNNNYHQLAESIEEKLNEFKPEILLTFEPRGVTGHIDHMAISMITAYVFSRLKSARELWYYCLTKTYREVFDDYFIYFPPGYNENEIDKTIDIEPVWDQKVAAMTAHTSQKADCELILEKTKGLPKKEYFILLRK